VGFLPYQSYKNAKEILGHGRNKRPWIQASLRSRILKEASRLDPPPHHNRAEHKKEFPNSALEAAQHQKQTDTVRKDDNRPTYRAEMPHR
jgi:hypothetical protein